MDILRQALVKFHNEFDKVMLSDTIEYQTLINNLKTIFEKDVSEMIGIKLTEIDKALQKDPYVKKKYRIEHSRRHRSLITEIGVINYERTYYRNRKTQECVYILDTLAKVNSKQRIGDKLMLDLVEASKSLSYRKASELVIKDKISAQTVMRAIRNTVPEESLKTEQRAIDVLHVDVDEDHVSIRKNGVAKSGEVKLAVAYEGIKDGKCVNSFAMANVDDTTEDYALNFLDELRARYDLTKTKIYVHSDGASWIKNFMGYIPNAVFVLDPYHKNKYITKVCGFLKNTQDSHLEKYIRQGLDEGKKDVVKQLFTHIKNNYPNRPMGCDDAMKYLLNNIDGISIRARDEEALNGGCSEQHVSNILAARISSRPSAWSINTLKYLAPILTTKNKLTIRKQEVKTKKVITKKTICNITKQVYTTNMLASVPVLEAGNVVPLYNNLRWVNY